MEFHQNLQTHSYDCYPAGVSNKHCLLPIFHLFSIYAKSSFSHDTADITQTCDLSTTSLWEFFDCIHKISAAP